MMKSKDSFIEFQTIGILYYMALVRHHHIIVMLRLSANIAVALCNSLPGNPTFTSYQNEGRNIFSTFIFVNREQTSRNLLQFLICIFVRKRRIISKSATPLAKEKCDVFILSHPFPRHGSYFPRHGSDLSSHQKPGTPECVSTRQND